jgi:hypothetical protein
MRPTKYRVLALAAAFVALAGCDTKPNATVAPATDSSSAPSSKPPSARQTADAFLKELGDGKITPDRLTASFKKKLSPPGKDVDAVALEWLTLFKGASFVIGEEAMLGEAILIRGRGKFADKSLAFSLRLVKDANGYKADWLQRSDRQGTDIKMPTDLELATAFDTSRNFIDLLLGGELRQAHTLMLPAWKKTISPPDAQDIREGYDFGPGFLLGRTRAWKGDFLGYTLSTGVLGPNKDSATFIATMDSGSAKTPFIVQAAKDTTGEWLVSGFEKQQ